MPKKKPVLNAPTERKIQINYDVKRKVKDLKFWKANPNEMNEDEYASLGKSIDEFGFVEPIVIAEENEILGGNWRATVMLNKDENQEVSCTEVIGLTREQKDKLGLALNKIHGQNNLEKLKGLIDSFSDPNQLLELGFTNDEMQMLDIDTTVFNPDGFSMDKEVKEKEVICPHCGFVIKGKQRMNVGKQKVMGAEQY